MGLVDLELNLTDEQKAMRDLARKFGAEVMRPAAIALDRLADPQDVIAKGSVLWDVFRQYRAIGLHRRGYPAAIGGLELDAMSGLLVGEELGYWASDLAISLGVSAFPFNLAQLSPDPQIRHWTRQYIEDIDAKMIGCWAITEPDHGSDWLLFDGPDSGNPKCAGSLRAVKDGKEYILNGQKAAWVSNGTIATHAALYLSLEPSAGMYGSGIAVVPLDLPGVSKGKPLNKIGQRALNQGEIFFDNVRIPEEMMVLKDHALFSTSLGTTLTGTTASMGVTFAGLARAAFDEALTYAKERVQGGKPIIEHQNIQLRLFKMFTMVEAARSLARRVTLYNRFSGQPLLQYSIAAKVLSTETAFNVASEAIQIFGGNGLSKDYHIEKLFRDAKASMIEDGVNETLALGAAQRLV